MESEFGSNAVRDFLTQAVRVQQKYEDEKETEQKNAEENRDLVTKILIFGGGGLGTYLILKKKY